MCNGFENLRDIIENEKEKGKNPLHVMYSYVGKLSERDLKSIGSKCIEDMVDYVIESEFPVKYSYVSSVIKSMIKIVRLDFEGFFSGVSYMSDYLDLQINMIIANKNNLFRKYDLLILDDIVTLVNISDYDMFKKNMQVLSKQEYDFVDLFDEYLTFNSKDQSEVRDIVKKIDIIDFVEKFKSKKNRVAFKRCFEYIVRENERISVDVICNLVSSSKDNPWVLGSFASVCNKEDGLSLMYNLLKENPEDDFLCVYSIEDKMKFYLDNVFRLNKNIVKDDMLSHETIHLFLKCLKHEGVLYN